LTGEVFGASWCIPPHLGLDKEEAMLKLKIEGMSCSHCVMHVKEAIAKVPGVQGSVEVSLEKREALVEGSPDVKALLAAVEEEGYHASLAS
jgi:copper chaperone